MVLGVLLTLELSKREGRHKVSWLADNDGTVVVGRHI